MQKSGSRLSSVSAAFYENPHLLLMTLIVICAAGLSAWFALPKIEDPRITQRFISVVTEFPGASARLVESSITEVLESELASISEIKTINSTSRSNVSVLAVELEDRVTSQTNQQLISRVRDRIKDASRKLPPQASVPKIIEEENIAYAYTLITAVKWQGEGAPQLDIMNRISQILKDRIEAVPGTEYVSLHGAPDETVQIYVEPYELAELGMTVQELAAIVEASDSKEVAGRLLSDKVFSAIEVRGEFDSLDRIRQLPVKSTSGDVLLRDIATVEKSYSKPEDNIMRVDGDRVILVAARIEVSSQINPWTASVKNVLRSVEAETGGVVSLDEVFEQASYTKDRLQSLGQNLMAGMIAVLLVVWLFMGWRSGLIVACSLPLAAACVLFALNVLNLQVQQMSMFGMIVAIGLLIDNAIVMTDEVSTRIKQGFASSEAIRQAFDHLFMPLLASTLTTILAFMPILLIEGNAGDFIGTISVSVILALIASFCLSMTVIPAICALLENKLAKPNESRWWQVGVSSKEKSEGYQRFLAHSLRKPWLAVVTALGLSIFGVLSVGSLPKVFFPTADRDMFELRVWFESNTSVPAADALVQEIDALIRNKAEVKQTVWSIGDSVPAFYYNQLMNNRNQNYYAEVVVTAEDVEASSSLIDELQVELSESFTQVQIVAKPFSQGPPVEAPIEFRVFGPETDVLRTLGEELRAIISQQSGVLHTQASVKPGAPKIEFDANETALGEMGLQLDSVAAQLQAAYEGVQAGSMLEDITQLPVTVSYENSQRASIEQLRAFPIVQPDGRWVPASAFGEFNLTPDAASITRRNGERVNIIHGYLSQHVTPIDITNAVVERLESGGWVLPEGYRWSVGGDAEESKRANASLAANLPVLVLLMVTCLVLAFRSFRLATIIGMVALLAAGFGFLSLWISGYALGFNPLIGITGLIGVAINGSIVVIAAMEANEKAKAGDHQEIINAVMSCTRHILSTTLTTIAGFIPLILLVGGQFWPPLAVVIAGGIGFSIILSLWFTPSIYVWWIGRSGAAARLNPGHATRYREPISAE
ncbi:hypothetical protein A3715_05955 [Oleiphilus sp. HI0009]|nr:efflux RND transporter permease subunit [Oleiphilus sp. HI0067]KZX82829.1 hypothetical protein A3715_05955 [Oleiphilus sp. HI0009]KZY67732.1 hypothetical protein A3739_12000 [Oleiphilus sp. HI0067]